MISALATALTLGPLALYFFVLGLWNAGRHPRIVHGPVDFGFLALALIGFIGFGPIGGWVVDRLFPGPSVWAWLVLPAALGLLAMLWLPRTARRLVVYNVEPGMLRDLLTDTLKALRVGFRETAEGFEDPAGTWGLRAEVGWRSRIALIEASGKGAESLVFALAETLRPRLARTTARPLAMSWLWFVFSFVVLLGPTFSPYVRGPQIQAAVRVLIDRIRR
jgi:hypothetical protein